MDERGSDSTHQHHAPGPRWSSGPGWRIGRILGVSLRVHPLFLAILAVVVIAAYRNAGAGGLQRSSLFLLCLLLTLLLHELGHALMARSCGAHVHDILIGPLVSMTRLSEARGESGQRMSWNELRIAAAGPGANLFLAAALLALAAVLAWFSSGTSAAALLGSLQDLLHLSRQSAPAAPQGAEWIAAEVLRTLFWFNLLLGLGNLLPAFPMDGGRILRALLTTTAKASLATRISVYISRLVATLQGVICMVIAIRSELPVDEKILVILVTAAIALFILSAGESELRKLQG